MRQFTSLMIKDNDGIRHNIPNTRYWKWEINEHGFRGKALALKKKEGHIRIFCLGGSETFGYFESKGNEWPAQLEKMIHDKFPRVEVINAAVVGLQSDKRKEYVEKYILPLKPDILIFYNHSFILFISKQMRNTRDAKAVKKTVTKKRRRNPLGLLEAYIRYLLKDEAGLRYLPRWVPKLIAMKKLRKKIKKREKKFLVNKKPLDEVPEHLTSAYAEGVRSFCDYLKKNNIIPVLTTFPYLNTASNQDKYKYELLFVRRYCIELSEKGIFDAIITLQEMIKKIAEEENIVCTDSDQVIPKTKEYFIDSYHYTNKGAEIIARNFYHALEQAGLLR